MEENEGVEINKNGIKNGLVDNGDGTKTRFWGGDRQCSKTFRSSNMLHKSGSIIDAESGDWILLGTVGVDSGCLYITDPAYMMDKDNLDSLQWDANLPDYQEAQLNNGIGIGVIFRSGLGDGYYEVKGKVMEIGPWGKRLSEVRIELIPEE